MTDTKTRTEWHTTAEGPDAERAELRRALAASELRAVNAVAAEDAAQFAFETARRRADRFEAALKQKFMEQLMTEVPEALENHVEALAESLNDDIAAGTLLDELDVPGHIESWAEGRTEYEADGFTPAGLEAPF